MRKAGDDLVRFFKFLPQDDDLTLLVLKGHLLIEEGLWSLLEKRARDRRVIAKLDLGFYPLCLITKALFYSDNDWFWNAMMVLNTMRNDLAHNLEPNRIDENCDKFIALVEANTPIPHGDTKIDRVRSGITFIAGRLSGMKRHVRKL